MNWRPGGRDPDNNTAIEFNLKTEVYTNEALLESPGCLAAAILDLRQAIALEPMKLRILRSGRRSLQGITT